MYKRIFSGIQPSGGLHLGNYFGAIRQWIAHQNACQNTGDLCMYSIVDLHSLTSTHDSRALSDNIKLMCASLIGCGLDPNKCVLFRQSSVPYHGQLCWILGTLCTIQQLQRFPQFKEKSENLSQYTPLGLLLYPVLQVADILLYKANCVPVGDDQIAHLNFAKHLTEKFNNKYGELFPIPQAININSSNDFCGRIRSLRHPEKKMSKSDLDLRGRIEMTDTADEVRAKIKRAVTDFSSEVSFDLNARPGVSNLVIIYSLITGLTPQQVCEQNVSLNTGQFKLELADLLVEYLKPIREEIQRLLTEDKYLSDILDNSESKAQEIAEKTMREVYDAIGVRF